MIIHVVQINNRNSDRFFGFFSVITGCDNQEITEWKKIHLHIMPSRNLLRVYGNFGSFLSKLTIYYTHVHSQLKV